MTENSFFSEQTPQSLAKARITQKYFKTWASIIMQVQDNNNQKYGKKEDRIAYIDLFAGPGRYENGSKSTPVMIIESAVNNDKMAKRLVTIFNDVDSNNVQELDNTLKKIEGYGRLKYKPDVWNKEVGTEIVKMFEQMTMIPTLFFVDPWGYKGLSLKLINSVLKDWGSDAIFFFNFNRINMGLTNPAVEIHMRSLFENQYDSLIEAVNAIDNPAERESQVVESLCQAIQGYGTRYTLPFCFKNSEGSRTSHHLIFVSKDFKGYDEMKKIMFEESSNHLDGVAAFEYNPRDVISHRQQLLFQLSAPLEELRGSLLNSYRGQVTTLADIYPKHSVDTPFIIKNYKEVLKMMYDAGIINAEKNGKPPRKGTFADDVVITFPS